MKVIGALFDDGNCSYKKAIEKYFDGKYEVHCVGINDKPFEDTKNYKYHKIDLSILNQNLIEQLLELPKPDFILASPPCESGSKADTIKTGYIGYVNNMNITGRYTYTEMNKRLPPNARRDFFDKQITRLLGEATIMGTIKIIEQFKPTHGVIENPQSSKTGLYQRIILDFYGEENLAYYSCYDDKFSEKATIFKSDLSLKLKHNKVNNDINMGFGYDERSKIPMDLIKDIIIQLENPEPQQERLF